MKFPVWTPLRVTLCEGLICISGRDEVGLGFTSLLVKHPQSPAKNDIADRTEMRGKWIFCLKMTRIQAGSSAGELSQDHQLSPCDYTPYWDEDRRQYRTVGIRELWSRSGDSQMADGPRSDKRCCLSSQEPVPTSSDPPQREPTKKKAPRPKKKERSEDLPR